MAITGTPLGVEISNARLFSFLSGRPLLKLLPTLAVLGLCFAFAEMAFSQEKRKDKSELPFEDLNLLGIDFSNGDIFEAVIDPDETEDGRFRLRDLERRIASLTRTFIGVERQRKPHASAREQMYRDFIGLQKEMATSSSAVAKLENALRLVNDRINVLRPGDNLRTQLENQRSNLLSQRASAAASFQQAERNIRSRVGSIESLNRIIAPFDTEMKAIWRDANQCRREWLEVCVPEEKYARCDYEKLKAVINNWSRYDGLWPQSHYWMALCSFELEQYDLALESLERGEEVRINRLEDRNTSRVVDATKGLVYQKSPKLRGRSAKFIQSAITGAEKNLDWEAFFISGRALLNVPSQESRARAYLEKALELRPSGKFISYSLAKLQISAKDERVQDSKGGLAAMLKHWDQTGRRSWRIAIDLSVAHSANSNSEDSEKYQKLALELASPAEREKVLKAISETR